MRLGNIHITNGYLKSMKNPRDTFLFEMYITKLPKNAKDKSLTDIYIQIE